MKKYFFCFLLFFWALKTHSQVGDNFSIECDANYYYYFVGNNSNNFNYGFSLLTSKNINFLKISAGINYSTKSYYSQEDPLSLILKRVYNLEYLNFPIIVNSEIYSRRKFSSSLLIGIAFNHIIKYHILSYYKNGEILIENILLDDKSLGVTFITGTTFSWAIGNKCLLNLAPFINYRLIPDHDNQRPDYKNIPNDKIAVGCKIGVELEMPHKLSH